MNVLSYFGIYERDINKADEICQNILYHAGLENRYDEMMEYALDYFYDMKLDSRISITNALIYCMFNSTKDILMKKYKNIDVDYYVNGYDSHLYINEMIADDFDFDELENGEEDDD